MKVLITGATGFLGKYIIDELVMNGYEVAALGRNEKAGNKLIREGVTFLKADFTVMEELEEVLLEKIDAVIHAGGLSTVWGIWEDFYSANVAGTVNILDICRKKGIEKLIFVSSPSIYAAEADQLDVKEEDAPLENNLSFYIRSKIMAEEKIREYKDIKSIIIRPRGLFGIGDTSIIPRLLKLNSTKGIPLFADGRQKVDVTCVENAALSVRLALEMERAEGQAYNITNGEPIMFKELLDMFFKEIGEEGKYVRKNYALVRFIVYWMEKIYYLFKIRKEPILTMYTLYLLKYSQTLSIEKARKELGYEPCITIAEGVRKYAGHIKRNQ